MKSFFVSLWAFWAIAGYAQEVDFVKALQATTERHPALYSKDANIEAKRFGLSAAKAQRYPSLTASYGQDNNREDTGMLSIKQPLWAFGRIDSNIAFAKQDVSVEYSDKSRLLRSLVEETAVAYARVWGIQRQQNIIAQNIATHQSLLGQVKRRQKGHLASEADVALATSRLIQAKGQNIKLQGEKRSALLSLQTLTQMPISQVLPIPEPFLLLPAEEDITSHVLNDSAEVDYRNQLVRLAEKEVVRKQSDYMPTLYVQLSHDFSDRSFYADETRVSLLVEGGLDGLGIVTRRQEQSSQSRLTAAKRDVQVAQFELQNQLNDLLAGRQTQRYVITSLQQAIEELNATLDSYQRQYQSGRKAWMDVLNIQRELTEQQLASVQAENSLIEYTLRLAALTGQLDVWPITTTQQ